MMSASVPLHGTYCGMPPWRRDWRGKAKYMLYITSRYLTAVSVTGS